MSEIGINANYAAVTASDLATPINLWRAAQDATRSGWTWVTSNAISGKVSLAPDAVQNVEAIRLTGGYKIRGPVLHSVLHSRVENFAGRYFARSTKHHNHL